MPNPIAKILPFGRLEIVQGVVGGWPAGSKDSGGHIFELTSWRRSGGPLETLPLIVITGKGAMAPAPWTIVSIKTRITEDGGRKFAKPRGPILPARDPLLEADRIFLAERPPLDDPLLGRLIWDSYHRTYSGKAEWAGREVGVSIEPDVTWRPGATPTAEFLTAHTVWADQERWTRDGLEQVIRDILEVGFGGWQEEPGRDVAAHLRAHMAVFGLTFTSNGLISIAFEAPEIFTLCEAFVAEGFLETGIAGTTFVT